MKSNLCTIRTDEMERFLLSVHPGFKRIHINGTFEEVYEAPTKNDPEVYIRIYTSISVNYDMSRPKGTDAIRIVLYHKKMDRIICSETTTKRLRNWKTTMKKKILSISKVDYKCKCGGYFMERDGRNGKFYGCSKFPVCRNTRNK